MMFFVQFISSALCKLVYKCKDNEKIMGKCMNILYMYIFSKRYKLP